MCLPPALQGKLMTGTGVVTLELACRYRDPGEKLLQAHSGLKEAGILHKVPLESHGSYMLLTVLRMMPGFYSDLQTVLTLLV